MRASDSDLDVAASVSPSSRKPRSRSTTRRSPSSPLAVSVSMPVFSKHGTTSSHPATSSSTQQQSQQPKREYRGKCLYQSRKCENERALKRNGKAHNLCDEHRSKQNQHQRKFDAKKFSRKKRRDSNVKSGDDDDDDEHEHEDMKVDVDADVSKDDGNPLPLQQPHDAHHQVETQNVRAAAPPRKRRRVTDDATPETYTRGSPQEYHASVYHQPRAMSQPPMVSNPHTAAGSGWRPPFAVVDHQPPPQLQHPYGQPVHHRAPYSPGYTNHHQQPQYDRPSAVSSGERLTMSRPPAPLRPLAAVTRSSPPSSRIQVSQLLHSEGNVSGPPQHHQHHGHVPGTVPYSPSPQYGRHPEDISLQHQRQAQSYPARQQQHEYSRYPEASGRPSVALPPKSSGFDVRVSPKYTHSELIAATVLVPAGTAPTPSAGVRHTATPRGAPAMPHPTSYAISPHHARPPTYEHQADKQQQYYLRAQQQTQHYHQQYPAEDERNRARTSRAEPHLPGPPCEGGSPTVGYHASYANPQRPSSTHASPPTAPPASFSALPGPRKLPSLAPPQFSQPPPHHPASAMTHRSPTLSGLPHHQRHPHPSSSPRQILPSLAPFRQARGSSGARPPFQTPTSSA
uniref:Uncharacterized protein n=1 Tax=Globisporangium ultimum (strain ATCC 200006 / CBS 805.95 / DAOM BR144) TaxID=431595 RepID=K3X993_GLOUD